jgi:group I intron endonuclease
MNNDDLLLKGVYEILCIENNKKYIGSTTKSFKERFNKHKTRLLSNTHENSHLQNAWNKYGADKFIFKILNIIEDDIEIKKQESKILELIFEQKNFRDAVFNLTSNCGGGNTLTTPEIRKKHADNHKKSCTPEVREKLRNAASLYREEFIKRVTESKKTEKYKINHTLAMRELAKNKDWIERNKKVTESCRKKVKTDRNEYFESIISAARYFKISAANISACLAGRQKTCNNRKWFYVEASRPEKE